MAVRKKKRQILDWENLDKEFERLRAEGFSEGELKAWNHDASDTATLISPETPSGKRPAQEQKAFLRVLANQSLSGKSAKARKAIKDAREWYSKTQVKHNINERAAMKEETGGGSSGSSSSSAGTSTPKLLPGDLGAMASHGRNDVRSRAGARLANIHGTIESGEERYAGATVKPPSRGAARDAKAKSEANAERYRKLVEMGVAGTPALDQGLKERYGVTPVKSVTPEKVKAARPSDQSLITQVANWLAKSNMSAAQALNNSSLAKRQKDVLRWMIDWDIDVAKALAGDHAADARVTAPFKTAAKTAAAMNLDVGRSALGDHAADARLTSAISDAANWLAAPVVPTKPKPKTKTGDYSKKRKNKNGTYSPGR